MFFIFGIWNPHYFSFHMLPISFFSCLTKLWLGEKYIRAKWKSKKYEIFWSVFLSYYQAKTSYLFLKSSAYKQDVFTLKINIYMGNVRNFEKNTCCVMVVLFRVFRTLMWNIWLFHSLNFFHNCDMSDIQMNYCWFLWS